MWNNKFVLKLVTNIMSSNVQRTYNSRSRKKQLQSPSFPPSTLSSSPPATPRLTKRLFSEHHYSFHWNALNLYYTQIPSPNPRSKSRLNPINKRHSLNPILISTKSPCVNAPCATCHILKARRMMRRRIKLEVKNDIKSTGMKGKRSNYMSSCRRQWKKLVQRLVFFFNTQARLT